MIQVERVFGLSLLKSPDYFGMTNDSGTDLLSVAHTAATVPKLICMFSVGLAFDLLGRRLALSTILILNGLPLALMPLTSPNQDLFVLAYVISLTAYGMAESSPLNMDYAVKKS